MISGRVAAALAMALPLLVSCGGGSSPEPRVDATPRARARALVAVAVSHIDGTPHSEDGRWPGYGEPRSLSAGIEYGINPESGYSGKSYSVDINVTDIAAYTAKDRRFFSCPAYAGSHCEETKVDEGTLLYTWNAAGEEEPAEYTWRLVRKHEVVRISYSGSEDFSSDPRKLDVKVDPDDLRAATLDPAMSLRTTEAAMKAGRALKRYYGEEKPPIKPVATPISPATLLKNTQVVLQKRATSSRPTTITDFGLKPVSIHLEFAGSATYDPVSADVFTATGRTPLLDPPPCKVGDFHGRVRTHCYGRDKNNFMFWEPASGGRPGVMWIVSVHFNTLLNRPESAAIRFESKGLTNDFFLRDRGTVRFSRDLRDNAYGLVNNLSPVSVRAR